MEKLVEKQSESITKLTSEVEESKSTDTAVLLYYRKYHEERAKKEQIQEHVTSPKLDRQMLM